jgi:hypothetical protein
MKGYIYYDFDGNFLYKTKQYIDTENPGFWDQNSMLIQRVWKIDTDIPVTLKQCFIQAQSLGVKPVQIKDMAKALNFDLNLILKQNDTKL